MFQDATLFGVYFANSKMCSTVSVHYFFGYFYIELDEPVFLSSTNSSDNEAALNAHCKWWESETVKLGKYYYHGLSKVLDFSEGFGITSEERNVVELVDGQVRSHTTNNTVLKFAPSFEKFQYPLGQDVQKLWMAELQIEFPKIKFELRWDFRPIDF